MTLRPILAAAFLVTAAPVALAQEAGTWSTFHGNLAAQKFSPATQITPENVGRLEKAWEVHTGDLSDGRGELPPSFFMVRPMRLRGTSTSVTRT